MAAEVKSSNPQAIVDQSVAPVTVIGGAEHEGVVPVTASDVDRINALAAELHAALEASKGDTDAKLAPLVAQVQRLEKKILKKGAEDDGEEEKSMASNCRSIAILTVASVAVLGSSAVSASTLPLIISTALLGTSMKGFMRRFSFRKRAAIHCCTIGIGFGLDVLLRSYVPCIPPQLSLGLTATAAATGTIQRAIKLCFVDLDKLQKECRGRGAKEKKLAPVTGTSKEGGVQPPLR